MYLECTWNVLRGATKVLCKVCPCYLSLSLSVSFVARLGRTAAHTAASDSPGSCPTYGPGPGILQAGKRLCIASKRRDVSTSHCRGSELRDLKVSKLACSPHAKYLQS